MKPITLALIALATIGVVVLGGEDHMSSTAAPVEAKVAKPNIIVILADDLGYADISAYKIDRFHTPNIDRIGMQGVNSSYSKAMCC